MIGLAAIAHAATMRWDLVGVEDKQTKIQKDSHQPDGMDQDRGTTKATDTFKVEHHPYDEKGIRYHGGHKIWEYVSKTQKNKPDGKAGISQAQYREALECPLQQAINKEAHGVDPRYARTNNV